ncbi:TPA: hypothetical protein DEB02_05250 [Candidatus Beckwithbacteria bacterium]|nr:hypothetical protein [Candidatus Beckwithbacteria bacterium]
MVRKLQSLSLKQLKSFQKEFERQTRARLQRRASSLAWFDSLIGPWEGKLMQKTPVAVVELGGSFLRLGVAESGDGKTVGWLKRPQSQKAVNYHLNSQDFVDWLAEKTLPFLKAGRAKRVGFIFSYPHRPRLNGRHITGVLTRLTKALVIPDAIGVNVGKMYLTALSHRGWPLKKLVTINDTVAVALSVPGAWMGLVMGTGANICSTHPKLKRLRNIEAGNFDGGTHTLASLAVDLLEKPGEQTMEKQTTGRYQYRVLAFAALTAGMRPELARAIMVEGDKVESALVGKISRGQFNLLKSASLTKTEKQELKIMAQIILENAWQMWGAVLAAVVKMNPERVKNGPVKIPVTGGVILNEPVFFNGLKATVGKLSGKKIELVKIVDPIRGAAVAALVE